MTAFYVAPNGRLSGTTNVGYTPQNTSQLTLFSEARARRRDPGTSRDAARAVQQHAGVLENLILTEFCLQDWLTDDELAERLPDHHSPTVKTCRSRLSKRGLLVDSGQVRKNSRGRHQIVWRLWNQGDSNE